MGDRHCVVVGGGLAGLLSSILVADRFDRVILLEKSDVCGGLLRSVQDAATGVYFDLGTHIPNLTAYDALNEILFGDSAEIEENWNVLDHYSAGNYFKKWYPKNQLIDTRVLPQEIYEKVIGEILSRHEVSSETDLDRYLRQTVGPTLTDLAITPILEKLYGHGPEGLATATSTGYFGLGRVIALTPEITNKLKELDAFDRKLGYHHWSERAHATSYLYPKKNRGIGFWMEYIVGKARSKGVEVLTNESVRSIAHQGGTVTSIELESGSSLDCDLLVWTAPAHLAMKAANIPLEVSPPVTRSTSLFHFVFDKELTMKEPLFLWCWDPGFRNFRITLYPNLNKHLSAPPSCATLEVLSTREEADKISLEEIFAEVLRLDLVPQGTRVLSQTKQTLHNTFPVPTHEFDKQVRDVYEFASIQLSNLMLAGRHGGRDWFLTNVVETIYRDFVLDAGELPDGGIADRLIA